MNLKVDVVIPTWNSARTLGRTLESVEGGIHPSRIIIVDRDSKDGTVELAKSHGCVVLQDMVSLGSARMKGVRESDTEWIVFIDDDVIVPNDFMTRMEQFIDDETGAVWSPCVSVVEPDHSEFLAILERKFEDADSYELHRADRGCTNATLVRRDLIVDLDISDMNAWEDWVITQRVLGSGKKWLVAKVYSDHIHQAADLLSKDSWNAAGILNLGRTGRITPYQAVADYTALLRRHLRLALEETMGTNDLSRFRYHISRFFSVLWGFRYFVGTKVRR
jgi:glycosyltransferase involved in cell wall biosynthesis